MRNWRNTELNGAATESGAQPVKHDVKDKKIMVEREDFAVGDEQLQVDRRARAGVVLSVRLSAEEADRLQDLANARGMTLSRIGREAIAMFLRTGGVVVEPGLRWTGGTPYTNTFTPPALTNFELLVEDSVSQVTGGTGVREGTAVAQESPRRARRKADPR